MQFSTIEKSPSQITEQFPDYYNFYIPVNVAITLALQIDFRPTDDFDPKLVRYYSQILPFTNTGKVDMTRINSCFDYALSLKELCPGGKIYVAKKDNVDSTHLAYVYQKGNKKYFQEPGMSHEEILIETGNVVKNDKYTIEVLESGNNDSFKARVTTALDSVFNFQFEDLERQDPQVGEIGNGYLGYLFLKHYLNKDAQIYLLNRSSEKLEVILYKPQDKCFLLVLPLEVYVADSLPIQKVSSRNQLNIFTFKPGDLPNLKEFLESKFSFSIYKDLVRFKQNLTALENLYNSGVTGQKLNLFQRLKDKITDYLPMRS